MSWPAAATLPCEWFDGLTAPHKELITYEDAGHSVVFEEADAFHRLMTEIDRARDVPELRVRSPMQTFAPYMPARRANSTAQPLRQGEHRP